MKIREEQPADFEAMDRICAAAFATVPYGTPHDAKITGLLRNAGALTLSLVAEDAGEILGHIAFSPVTIGGAEVGWFCLGPVAVAPEHHGKGVGGAMIREGLMRLQARGARGCVLLGNPDYYSRFGFTAESALLFNGESSPYLQALCWQGDMPAGEVGFHPAFFEG